MEITKEVIGKVLLGYEKHWPLEDLCKQIKRVYKEVNQPEWVDLPDGILVDLENYGTFIRRNEEQLTFRQDSNSICYVSNQQCPPVGFKNAKARDIKPEDIKVGAFVSDGSKENIKSHAQVRIIIEDLGDMVNTCFLNACENKFECHVFDKKYLKSFIAPR